MRSIVPAIVSAFLAISASSLLSGCGGSGSSDPASSTGPTPGSPAYGTLTPSGTGTAVTGTTFNAYSRLAISGSGTIVTQW